MLLCWPCSGQYYSARFIEFWSAMAPKTELLTEGRVIQLLDLHFSYASIIRQLEKSGIIINIKAVTRISFEYEQRENGATPMEKTIRPQNLPKVRSPGNITKVATSLKRKDPPTQRQLATQLGCSVSTISKIIHENLDLSVRKKRKTHHLTEKQAAQRLERAPLLLQYLGMFKSRLIFTMDECLITLNDFNRGRPIYYVGDSYEIPDDWKKTTKKFRPIQVMVALGICWEGQSKVYFVDPEAKINKEYFVEHILTPMVTVDIPRLYGKRAKDVTLHMDSAPAHTATYTTTWLADHNQKLIKKRDWPANSPDLAPMDYAVHGILKQILNERRPTTESGIKKVIIDVWDSFPLSIIRDSLASWKFRVELMKKAKGYQIEHLL